MRIAVAPALSSVFTGGMTRAARQEVERTRPERSNDHVDYLVYVLWAAALLVMVAWYI